MMKVRIPESELFINSDGSIYHLAVRAEDVADLIITVGDPDRVENVSRYLDQVEFRKQKREFVTHTGYLGKQRISVMSTGMGTDNIEIFMTELDALVNVDLKSREIREEHKSLRIIRIGTSGSMQSDLPEGECIASAAAVGLDTLMTFYNLEMASEEKEIARRVKETLKIPFEPYCVRASKTLLNLFQGRMKTGVTVTCPGFFGPQGRQVRTAPAMPMMIHDLAALDFGPMGRLTNFEMETAGYYSMGRLLGHETLSLNALVANRITQRFATNMDQLVDSLIRTTLEAIVAG
jgi:uridine phosphorylase